MDYAQTALMAAATSFSTSTVRTDPATILRRADLFLKWLEQNEPEEDEEKHDTTLDALTERADQEPPNQELHTHHRDEPGEARRIGF
jgi:hypothetical protein